MPIGRQPMSQTVFMTTCVQQNSMIFSMHRWVMIFPASATVLIKLLLVVSWFQLATLSTSSFWTRRDLRRWNSKRQTLALCMKTTKRYLKRRGTAPRIFRSTEPSLTLLSVNSHENNLQYLLERRTHGTARRSRCDSEQNIPALRRIKSFDRSVTSYVIYTHTLAFSVGYTVQYF
jgi:hypothetical protein